MSLQNNKKTVKINGCFFYYIQEKFLNSLEEIFNIFFNN